MVIFYFDTSALVKRYHEEIGSKILDKIFEIEKYELVILYWTVLEFVVAFSSLKRRKEISNESFSMIISRFLKDTLDKFTVTGVNDELIALATPMAIKYALPSADCVQLAGAINLKKTLETVKEELVLICSDKGLCRAAQREGMTCINPEAKDALKKLKTITP